MIDKGPDLCRLCDNLGAFKAGKPGRFAHGRVVYTLEMGGACFMDLSVMPLTDEGE